MTKGPKSRPARLRQYCSQCGALMVLGYSKDESSPWVPMYNGVCLSCGQRVSYSPHPDLLDGAGDRGR